MSIRHVILGFLEWKSLTGYELKKLLASSPSLPWSGNNNQVYKALIQLHQEGLVELEEVTQEKYPTRKVYSITDGGRAELRSWLLSPPPLPEYARPLLFQLAWSQLLDEGEVAGLLRDYAERLSMAVLIAREEARRRDADPSSWAGRWPGRSPRESLVWSRIEELRLATMEAELRWATELSAEIEALAGPDAGAAPTPR